MIKALLKHMGLYEYEVKGAGDTAVSERTMYELSRKLTYMVQKTQNQVNGMPSSGNRNDVGVVGGVWIWPSLFFTADFSLLRSRPPRPHRSSPFAS